MIETAIDQSQRIIFQNCQGDVALFDVLTAMVKLYEHEDFDPHFPVIWNLLEANVQITIDQINNLPPEIVEIANARRPVGKTAWVPRTTFGEITLQMLYENHDWGAVWKTFSTLESAIAWCKGRAPRLTVC